MSPNCQARDHPPEQLIEHYQQHLKQFPQDVDGHHGLAIAYYRCQRWDQSLESLKKARALDPKQASILNSLGNVYCAMGNFALAKQAYKQALKRQKNYLPALNNLGKCYYQTKEWKTAEGYYQRAIHCNPEHADTLLNRAILYYAQHQYHNAIDSLQTLMDKHPSHLAGQRQLMDIYLNIDQPDQAIKLGLHIINTQPNCFISHYKLVVAYTQTQQWDSAKQQALQLLALCPEHEEIHQVLGNIYLHLGDIKMAQQHYYQQLSTKCFHETLTNLGTILMNQNHLDDALMFFQTALKEQPQHLPTHLNCGAIYLKKKDLRQALIHYQSAQTQDPDNESIAYILQAITQSSSPSQAPSCYVSELFDHYAPHYDHHLTDHLNYRAHQVVANYIDQHWPLPVAQTTLLDLGCGTGLAGQACAQYAHHLIGVDLSEKMLEQARSKAIYHSLQQQSLTTALNSQRNIPLIIAVDVMPYIGDCRPLFAGIAQCLAPGGWVILTYETCYDVDYQLSTQIRYRHHPEKLAAIAEQLGLQRIDQINLIIRHNDGKPIHGQMGVWSKPEPL